VAGKFRQCWGLVGWIWHIFFGFVDDGVRGLLAAVGHEVQHLIRWSRVEKGGEGGWAAVQIACHGPDVSQVVVAKCHPVGKGSKGHMIQSFWAYLA